MTVEHPHCGTGEVRIEIVCASVSTSVKLYKTYSIQSLQAKVKRTNTPIPMMPALSYSYNLDEAEIALGTLDHDFEKGSMVK